MARCKQSSLWSVSRTNFGFFEEVFRDVVILITMEKLVENLTVEGNLG